MSRLHVIALSSWLLAMTSISSADEPHRTSSYEGVRPGQGNPPPAAERIERRRSRGDRAQILTWPGFQMLEGGGSRFFVQTTGAVRTEVRTLPGRVEVVFPGTTIHLSNSTRWLDTRFFETPVTRARLERRGRDMVFVMHMRATAVPTVSSGPSEAAGFEYTYIDFERGQFVPAPESPSGSVQ